MLYLPILCLPRTRGKEKPVKEWDGVQALHTSDRGLSQMDNPAFLGSETAVPHFV
jgi:hypothetical protein